MDFDRNKARGVSSPDNCSSICVEGTLIQVNPLSHYWKPKGWKSLGKLEKHKPSYESIPSDSNPKQGDEGSDEATASTGGVRCFTDLSAVLVCEVLARLDAKELGIVSCVSTLLHALATDHQGWEKLYCERWGLPNLPATLNGPVVPGGPLDRKSWKTFFVERELRSKSFLGRFNVDVLRGHNEDGCAVFLLASANLIFTGGRDSVVRMWNMEEGLLIDASRPLPHLVAPSVRLQLTLGY